MRLAGLLIAAIAIPLPSSAQKDPNPGRYPEVRALLHEAETAAVNIEFLDDRSNPHTWMAGLYARAGYLDDAARAFCRPNSGPGPHYALWRAQVIYGDLPRAEKSLMSIPGVEQRAGAMASLGDLLWRMGETEKARERFLAARDLAQKVGNVEHRKRLLKTVEQGLTYLSEEPPNRISPVPKPQRRPAIQDSPVPLFPISTDGFRDLEPDEVARRTKANGEFMKQLYDLMAAGDRNGLERLAEQAATPFQKAIGMASIEHILIQASQPGLAEQYAQRIDTPNSDCSLAKAEALAAAGAAWSRAGDATRAHANFKSALDLIDSVSDLVLGKITVTLSVASAQAAGGLMASAGTTFRSAKQMAETLPVHPAAGKPGEKGPRVHYRDEAYRNMLVAAIRAHDMGFASEVAKLWTQVYSSAGPSIVRAWLDADRVDDAMTSARQISDSKQRVKTLLVLASSLLDEAGAPLF